METNECDINKPVKKEEIYFSKFAYGKKYSVTIIDLLKGNLRKENDICEYLIFSCLYHENYEELDILKGSSAKTSFPENAFLSKLDYVLRKDGKQRSQFIKPLRYDLNITFIRHSKYRFQILSYSFDPAHNKI